MEWKLHAFVLIQAAYLAAKSFLKHNQATIAQGKVGFFELCASPLGVRIRQISSYWCMRKKQSLKAERCARGTSKTRLVPDLETMI